MRRTEQAGAHFRERRHRCTSCRRKPDQHDVYAQLRRIRQPFAKPPQGRSRAAAIGWLAKSWGPTRHPAQPLPVSHPHSPEAAGCGSSPRLLSYVGLLGLIYQHAVSTFNTCSAGPTTERSLTDTDGATTLKSQTSPSQPIHIPVRSPINQ